MKTFLLYLRGGDKIKSIAKSITIKNDEKKAEKLKTSITKENHKT